MIKELAFRAATFFARVTNPNRRLVRVFGARHIGGVWLTHDEALKLSAVWACVSVISKAIASSTWDIFQEKPNGDRDYLPGSKIYYLLNVRPNREMTPVAFHETMVACALLWGNSYAEIERDRMNRPVALWPLEPWRCFLTRGYFDERGDFSYDMSGELAVRVENYDRPDSFIHYADVYHIHGLGLDGACGLDLVGLASRSLLQTLASERFALKYYEHGTSMGGVLSSDKDLQQEDLDGLKKGIKDRVSGVDNAFEFLVVGGGLKFQPLAGTLHDGQFNDTRYFLIEETCRWFGVPPHKIQHLLHATFSNIEHLGIEFNRDGLRVWKVRCEQEADFKLLPVGPYSLCINTDWAAEGDSKTQAEEAAILVSNGLIRRNEWRRKKGKNSLGEEGNALTIAANMTTMKKLLQAPPGTTTTPPNTPPNTPNADDPKTTSQNVAKRFLALAIARGLKRQLHRAEDAARRSKGNRREFERMLNEGENAQLYYVQNSMTETQNTCDEVGIYLRFDKDNFAKKACAEERVMLITAYDEKRLSAFCDIDQRADSLAEQLAANAF